MAPRTNVGALEPCYPIVQTGCIGGQGGNSFWSCVCDFSGNRVAVVQKLTVWWNGDGLNSIQLIFSDGSTQGPFGRLCDDHANITFKPGERITNLTTWGNGKGSRCGKISIQTSLGQNFIHGKDTSGQVAYNMPVYSGILMGAYGNCGSWLDHLGLLFLAAKVKEIDVTNVAYDTPFAGSIELVSIDRVVYSNRSNMPGDFNFSGDTGRVVVHTWESSAITTWSPGAKLSLTVPILDLAGSPEAGFTWDSSKIRTVGGLLSYLHPLNWKVLIQVAPGQSIVGEASVWRGIANVTWSGDIKLTLTDGNSFTYRDSTGKSSNVVVGQVQIAVRPAASFDSYDMIEEFHKAKMQKPKSIKYEPGKSHGH